MKPNTEIFTTYYPGFQPNRSRALPPAWEARTVRPDGSTDHRAVSALSAEDAVQKLIRSL